MEVHPSRKKAESNPAVVLRPALPRDSHFSILAIKTLRLQSVIPQHRM